MTAGGTPRQTPARAETARGARPDEDARRDEVVIRECTTVGEFDACVRLQRAVFGLPDLEISPRRHLIVARTAGGFTLGAFLEGELVGFALQQVALHGGRLGGYSHMAAVDERFQSRGIGARLKWAQRERTLSEGRDFIKWTFDPMRARNAHFNLNRLGAVVRTYAADYYGTDYHAIAGLHGEAYGLASDRLFAEWELSSPRVEAIARGAKPPPPPNAPAAAVEIPPDWGALMRADAARARAELARVRAEFQNHFAAGLVCAGFERDEARPRYLFFRE
ncbi:MAG: acetyltransferase [Acidobacteria bacterium]|nr:acetyltransferase [Acidobacteriota bacterium]